MFNSIKILKQTVPTEFPDLKNIFSHQFFINALAKVGLNFTNAFVVCTVGKFLRKRENTLL